MNRIILRAGCKQLGLGAALVGLATLLTMLFSFLGTIACAVITGMMFGTFRQWRWEVIGASMVFPGVILGLVQFAQANLPWPKNIELAVVCFAGFWLSFLLTWGLMLMERRASAPSRTTSALRPAVNHAVLHEGPPDTVRRNQGSNLQLFQGCWVCASPGLNEQIDRRELEIRDSQAVLRVREVHGQIRTVSIAELKLANTDRARAPS